MDGYRLQQLPPSLAKCNDTARIRIHALNAKSCPSSAFTQLPHFLIVWRSWLVSEHFVLSPLLCFASWPINLEEWCRYDLIWCRFSKRFGCRLMRIGLRQEELLIELYNFYAKDFFFRLLSVLWVWQPISFACAQYLWLENESCCCSLLLELAWAVLHWVSNNYWR